MESSNINNLSVSSTQNLCNAGNTGSFHIEGGFTSILYSTLLMYNLTYSQCSHIAKCSESYWRVIPHLFVCNYVLTSVYRAAVD